MVQLNNEERKVLLGTVALLQAICDMGGSDTLVEELLVSISESSPLSGKVITNVLAQLPTEERGVSVVCPVVFREFMNDMMINVGQLHDELKGKFQEYRGMEIEARRERREWFAVECAEKLIEPKLLEELKPIMVKLRGDLQ